MFACVCQSLTISFSISVTLMMNPDWVPKVKNHNRASDQPLVDYDYSVMSINILFVQRKVESEVSHSEGQNIHNFHSIIKSSLLTFLLGY